MRGELAGKPLSPREAQILELLMEGKAQKNVALELGISLKTVQNHMARAYAKLGAVNVTNAAYLYLKRRWQEQATAARTASLSY